jgi:peptidoglycan/LPS O-acetylase OafA/YrhL
METGVRAEVSYITRPSRGCAAWRCSGFSPSTTWSCAQGFVDDPWIRLVGSLETSGIIVRNGYLGVDLFFLITGFLLTLPWFRHASQGLPPPATREFYRAAGYVDRILPAYYVQLIFLFLVCLPLLRAMTFWKTDLAFYLVNFAAHVTMLFYTTPVTSASLSLNGALWTLALETQYYLLRPLLAPLFVRAPRITAGVMFALAIAWHWAALHDLKPWSTSRWRSALRPLLLRPRLPLLTTQIPRLLRALCGRDPRRARGCIGATSSAHSKTSCG